MRHGQLSVARPAIAIVTALAMMALPVAASVSRQARAASTALFPAAASSAAGLLPDGQLSAASTEKHAWADAALPPFDGFEIVGIDDEAQIVGYNASLEADAALAAVVTGMSAYGWTPRTSVARGLVSFERPCNEECAGCAGDVAVAVVSISDLGSYRSILIQISKES